jgi:hypothetical protein
MNLQFHAFLGELRSTRETAEILTSTCLNSRLDDLSITGGGESWLQILESASAAAPRYVNHDVDENYAVDRCAVAGKFQWDANGIAEGQPISEPRQIKVMMFGDEVRGGGIGGQFSQHIRLDFGLAELYDAAQSYGSNELDQIYRDLLEEGDTLRFVPMMDRIGKNFDFISVLVRNLIEGIGPSHAILCLDCEVHPFTSIGLYHASLHSWIDDLRCCAAVPERRRVVFGGAVPAKGRVSMSGGGNRWGEFRRRQPDRPTMLTDISVLEAWDGSLPGDVHTSELERAVRQAGELAEVWEVVSAAYVQVPVGNYVEEPFCRLFERISGHVLPTMT